MNIKCLQEEVLLIHMWDKRETLKLKILHPAKSFGFNGQYLGYIMFHSFQECSHILFHLIPCVELEGWQGKYYHFHFVHEEIELLSSEL